MPRRRLRRTAQFTVGIGVRAGDLGGIPGRRTGVRGGRSPRRQRASAQRRRGAEGQRAGQPSCDYLAAPGPLVSRRGLGGRFPPVQRATSSHVVHLSELLASRLRRLPFGSVRNYLTPYAIARFTTGITNLARDNEER